MRTEKKQYYLHELVDTLPPAKRALILEIIDPSSLSKQIPITGARAIDLAEVGEITFCKDETHNLMISVVTTQSCFLVVRPTLLAMLPSGFTKHHVLILTSKPRLLLASLLTPFDAPPSVSRQKEPIHPNALIAPDACLGPGVVIGEDVQIGKHCVIGPNTVIDNTTIGNDTHIGFNCSLGVDGFGYEVDEDTGDVIKFPHFGRIQIGRHVEIFSNVCIARGSLRDTILEDEVKVDNLVHIAHNCHIKHGAFLVANVMLGGSSNIGEYAWIAPTTSIMNGITIGRCSMTGLGAVVTKSVGDNELVVGVPAKKMRGRFPQDHPLLRTDTEKGITKNDGTEL